MVLQRSSGTAPQAADLIRQPNPGAVTLALVHVGAGQFIGENRIAQHRGVPPLVLITGCLSDVSQTSDGGPEGKTTMGHRMPPFSAVSIATSGGLNQYQGPCCRMMSRAV